MSAVPWAILSFIVGTLIYGWVRLPRDRPLRLTRSGDGFTVRGGFQDVTWTSDARGAQLHVQDVGWRDLALQLDRHHEWTASDSARAEQLLRDDEVQAAIKLLWTNPAVQRVEIDNVLRVRCTAVDDPKRVHVLLHATFALAEALRACAMPALVSTTVSASSSPVAVSSLRRDG